MAFHKLWAASRKTKAATGYRSKPEAALATGLAEQNTPFIYEGARIPYTTPAVYLPDFGLLGQAIVIEVKGPFTSADRTKMLRVKEAHPALDIRFLFVNPGTRLSRKSKTTYGDWCRKHGFPCALGPLPPKEWLAHKPNPQQKEAFQRIFLNGTQKKD